MEHDENRPPIPADIKRKVLVEAGHRCAIPTCRYIEVEIHHIAPCRGVGFRYRAIAHELVRTASSGVGVLS